MRKNNFVEKTIAASVSIIQESVFSEDIASAKGLMQSFDPRFKVLSVFAVVLCALLVRHVGLLIIMYAACLVLAWLSRIKAGFFLKRTLLFIPLFSFFIALPSVFNFITPGEAVWSAGRISITKQGIVGAAVFIARVTVSVSFVVLLSLVTRHFELLKAIGAFGIPQVFVMTAGMCYRYIYLFAEIVGNTFLAIKSRAGGVIGAGHGQKIAAWNMAMLWKRSYTLNGQVYDAMLSRGFSGEAVSLKNFKAAARDFIWLLSCLAAVAAILAFDRFI